MDEGSLREGGIPFEVRLEQPNKETVAAMLEAERIATVSYTHLVIIMGLRLR